MLVPLLHVAQGHGALFEVAEGRTFRQRFSEVSLDVPEVVFCGAPTKFPGPGTGKGVERSLLQGILDTFEDKSQGIDDDTCDRGDVST